MPETGEFVDALREAFGADEINAIVRRGRAGEPVFFAREAGHEFGTPLPSGRGWDAAGVRDRHYCPGCVGECVETGERCSARRAAPSGRNI
ncbi:hypothetical protein ABLT15_30000 [Paraburkholderia tropica]|uniref:hypothetical protein n=1 Tax=Paraburkholderia tropica TaxID=92647 RepID=UPI0032B51BFD